jgi:glucokinase
MTGQGLCLAIDVGGTNVRMALVDQSGAVVARRRQPCTIQAGRDQFLADLGEDIVALRQEAERLGQTIDTAGAGVPGLIDRSGQVLSSVNLQALEGLNFREALGRLTEVPAVVLNDANAAACGEKWYGSGQPFASLLMLTIGTGIGSGLILDNRLWLGSDGVAGEYGHMTIDPAGVPCPCGNRGCLEQYASATALVRMAQEELAGMATTSLLALAQEELTAATLAQAAVEGDQLALSLFERAGTALGIAAATAANLLNLDALILGGGVAASFPLLAPIIGRVVHERAFPLPAARLRIIQGALGDDAGLLGAAAAAWRQLAEDRK